MKYRWGNIVVILFYILIVIFNADYFKSSVEYIYLSFASGEGINPDLAENIFTILSIPLLMVLLFIYRKRINFTKAKLLIWAFINLGLFSNMFAPFHPNYQTGEINKPLFSKTNIFINNKAPKRAILKFKCLNLVINEYESAPEEGIKISKVNILGTDKLGRDIFSRLLYSIRLSLFVGFASLLINFILGSFLGYLSGISENYLRHMLNLIGDTLLAFPMLFLALMLLLVLGNKPITLILFLGFTGWMGLYKIVRDETIIIKTKPFYQTSKLIGLSKIELLFKEVFPIIKGTVLVNLTLQFCNIILAESALSFIGINAFGDLPTLGKMINEGQNFVSGSLITFLVPTLTLIVLLLSVNEISNEIKCRYAG